MKKGYIHMGFVVAVMASMIACGPTQEEKEKEELMGQARDVHEKAIAIHDKIMPMMGEMMDLQKSLEARADSIEQTSGDSTQVAKMRDTISDLETASEDMMVWMRNVKDVPGSKHGHEHDDAQHEHMEGNGETMEPMAMLEEQEEMLARIEKIEQDFMSSMARAKELLE